MNVINVSLYKAMFGNVMVTGGVRLDSAGNLAPGRFSFFAPNGSAVRIPVGLSFVRREDDTVHARVDFNGGDTFVVEGNFLLGRLTADENEVPSVFTIDPNTKHITEMVLFGSHVVPAGA